MKNNERIKSYRARNRAAGLRLVQFWVPDTRSPVFAAECRRQSALLRGDRIRDTLVVHGRHCRWRWSDGRLKQAGIHGTRVTVRTVTLPHFTALASDSCAHDHARMIMHS